jgi:hypothetical protein
LKPQPPKYKGRILTTWQLHLVSSFQINFVLQDEEHIFTWDVKNAKDVI